MINVGEIKILAPNCFKFEREYALTTVFCDFMNIPIKILYEDREDYKLSVNGWTISIENAFFAKNNNKEPLSYLYIDNIPQTLIFQNVLGKELPLMWGSGKYTFNGKNINLGNDLFAIVFFFLTQWEEFVLKKEYGLNKYQKLDEQLLFVFRNGLQKHCLINEIVNFFEILLRKCGIEKCKKNKFNVMLTHDVDRCYLSSYEELCDNIYKMLLHGENERAKRILGDYLYYAHQNKNPFDSFNELMNISEFYGFKSHFYFKPCINGDLGYTYSINDDFVRNILNSIRKRGHCIGLHATENTSDSFESLRLEYERLLEAVGENCILGGRTHGLIYDMSIMENLNALGLSYDSGVGFQNSNGFRTQVCYPYYVFDILKRKKLALKEVPFMVMDSVALRNNMSADDFFRDAMSVIEKVKMYNGCFVMNWHSNLFDVREREDFKKIYKEIVKYLSTC